MLSEFCKFFAKMTVPLAKCDVYLLNVHAFVSKEKSNIPQNEPTFFFENALHFMKSRAFLKADKLGVPYMYSIRPTKTKGRAQKLRRGS